VASSTTEPRTGRKRPRDRRERIVAAAAALFWERGYRRVGMADVAGRVEIGASALYRHFSGKSDLLVAVLNEGLARLEETTSRALEPSELLTAVARAGIERREHAALWDREFGELPPDVAAAMQLRRDRVFATLRAVAPTGPDATVRTRAALAVLQSPSYHHVELDPDDAVALLHTAATACLTATLPRDTGSGQRASPGPLVPHARREALLATAGRLFAERGYHAVSLTEIGAVTGIAGPSIYNYFASKLDLLSAILNRGNETLWFGLHRALSDAIDAPDALGRLIDNYTSVVGGTTGVVPVLLTEGYSLSEGERGRYLAAQTHYVAEWVELLRQARPELAENSARLLVHAAFAVPNALGAGPSGSAIPARQLRLLSRAVLGLPPIGEGDQTDSLTNK
jgi:AcrR family transcriptional regulator